MKRESKTRVVFEILRERAHEWSDRVFTSETIHEAAPHLPKGSISAPLYRLEREGCIRRVGTRPSGLVEWRIIDVTTDPDTRGGMPEGIRRRRRTGYTRGGRAAPEEAALPPAERQYVDAAVAILALLEQEIAESRHALEQALTYPDLSEVPESALWEEIKRRRARDGGGPRG